MIKLNGELLERIQANRTRIADKQYCVPEVFANGGDWPGDWQGRTILSLASLYNALEGFDKERKDILKQLTDILDALDKETNQYGYFGALLNPEKVDEQQISGNSWFLRGLCESYLITKDEKILDRIHNIINNYLLKLSDAYDKYEIKKRHSGEVSGCLSNEIDNCWKYSSDVGCAFIMLDGMSHCYALTKNQELKKLIDKLVDRFSTTDYVGLAFQTHATCSCTRGIIRMYENTGDKVYLSKAITIFDNYLNFGMTKDYCNMNWFNKPNSWTEPCCIVDSYIIAAKLFRITNDHKYLTILNRIYLNALPASQRSNGGAGCNTCLNDENNVLKCFLYEAFFCCSMRLSEGLKCIVETINTDNRFLFFFEGRIETEEYSAQITGDVYKNNEIIFERTDSGDVPVNIEFYLHKDYEMLSENVQRNGNFVSISLKPCEKITVGIQRGYHLEGDVYYLGDNILFKNTGSVPNNSPKVTIDGTQYEYVMNYLNVKEEDAEKVEQCL